MAGRRALLGAKKKQKTLFKGFIKNMFIADSNKIEYNCIKNSFWEGSFL